MKTRNSILMLTGLLFSVAANAGSVLKAETKEFDREPPVLGSVEVFTDGQSTRVEVISISSSESGGIIYRAANREMIALDHGRQQYVVINQEQIDRMAAQMSDAMRQMQEALKSMPPEQRAMAEQMMGRQMGMSGTQPAAAPLEIAETGDSDTVAGMDCDYYEVTQAGRKIRDLCVAGWNDIEGGRETADGMMAMADFFNDMREAFSRAGNMAVLDRQQDMFQHMRELDGYPVLARDYDDTGAIRMETRLTSASEEDVDPYLFGPPEGYTEQKIPQM